MSTNNLQYTTLGHTAGHKTLGALAVALLLLTGCQDAGPARGPIQGRVTVAGKPLEAGRILFVPIAPTEGPATSATIVDGAYQLSDDEGPVIGTHRVEVEAELPLGFAIDDEAAFAKRGGRRLPPNPIPPEFNRRSKLVVEISADEENSFDVAVPYAQGGSVVRK